MFVDFDVDIVVGTLEIDLLLLLLSLLLSLLLLVCYLFVKFVLLF